MRAESFPLRHAAEDALGDTVSPQGAASDVLMRAKMKQLALPYDAADRQHQRCCMPNVLRIWLASYSLRVMQFKLNSHSAFNPDWCLAAGDTPLNIKQ
jgi:hypothetical protein